MTRGRPTKIRDWRRHSIDLPRVVAIASKFRSIEDASTAMPLTDQRQQRRRDTKQRRRRDLLGRLLRWRVGLHWYLFVLFGLPVGVLLSAIVCTARHRSGRSRGTGACSSRVLAGRRRALPAHQPVGGARMDGFLAVNAAGQARALACEPDSGPILRALPRWSGETPNQASSAEAWEDLLSHVLTGPFSLSDKALAS